MPGVFWPNDARRDQQHQRGEHERERSSSLEHERSSFRVECSDDPRFPLGPTRRRLASASLTNSSLTGSNFRSRFSHMQMLAAWTVVMERCITSGLATVGCRDLTQSRKLRMWFIGRWCGRT